MSEWQPVETAPAGKAILVWSVAGSRSNWNSEDQPVWVVIMDEDGDFHIEHDGDGGVMEWRGASPTHWMPVPSAPDDAVCR